MSQSSGSTVPFSPGTRASYTDIENAVFANLRPFGEDAWKAFDVVGNWIEANPTQSTNARQFFNAQHVSKRATSESPEEIVESTAGLAREWVGTYQLRLNQLSTERPHWILGSGSDEIDRPADLLLAPPSANRAKPRIAYDHAILYFNQDTSRIMLQARHTVMVCSRGAQALRGPEARVIEHDEVLMIDNCVYVFEFTDFAKTRTYEDALVEFMRKQHSSNWLINKHLLPTSVQDPIILGNYFCSPSTFAQGTFGKVAVGWAKGGRGVAIKTFKKPEKTEIATHVQQMKEIGEHPNILQLLECISHFDINIPDAYCIYSPLAFASLSEIINEFEIDASAQAILYADYLRGLTFLHDQKLMMHRDINPNNLTVRSLKHIQGIIIDLDAVTTSPSSSDHLRGTLPYLAPEIIALKEWEKAKVGERPSGYGKSVDIWALGLSMYAVNTGSRMYWPSFQSSKGQAGNIIDKERYEVLSQRLDTRISRAAKRGELDWGILETIKYSLSYKPKARPSAARNLEAILMLSDSVGDGMIRPKQGTKRAHGGKFDAPSYTLQAFVPRVTQDAYLAIRAFNIDIARVADSISSTSLGANIGKMRMQFWRDAVDKSYAQEPPKEPVAILLTQALNQLRDRGQKLPLKAWFHKVIQAREQYLNNPPYPSLSALESYSESTYSTLLYLTLAFIPMNSVTCDHIASHIGKAAGISTVLRGLPLLAFPPPPKHHSNTAGLGGVTGTQRQGTVLLPLEVMAEAGVKEEDVLRKGGDAPGLKDAVFKVATLANDHLITARTMLMNVRRGEDIGHPYEHEGEEGHGPETRKNASAPAQDVDRAFGVFLPAVATQLWLDRLEKCDFNVFDPSLRRSNWKLPLKAYLADRRKRF